MNDFDLLILYTSGVAFSPDLNSLQATPFVTDKASDYNESYSYFLKHCSQKKLKAALVTTSDITDSGNFKGYWQFHKNKWTRVNQEVSAKIIFAKYTLANLPPNIAKKIVRLEKTTNFFTDQSIHKLFKNKIDTYRKLPEFSIPSVQLEGSDKQQILNSLNKLQSSIKRHPHSYDFEDSLVIKDSLGAGGNNVFKISNNFTENIYKIVTENKDISFIIQPFIKYANGNLFKEYSGFVDIRLVILNSKIIQSYIRLAKPGDFRCNIHQGGKRIFIDQKQIPDNVLALYKKIIRQIDQQNSMYSLDFIKSDNGNIYLIEGNSSPGLDWTKGDKISEVKMKYLIRKIVQNIKEKLVQ